VTHAERQTLHQARVWIEDWLLGDVRTFLLGMETKRREGIQTYQGASLGAGNLSVPILLSTATELLAALYSGSTQYSSGAYNAADNVACFVKAYWPAHYHRIAHLLWDGMRNGLTHTLSAKWFRSGGGRLDVQFSVEAESVVQWRGADHVGLVLSVHELYKIVDESARAYLSDLRNDAELWTRFHRAFHEFVGYRRDVSGDKHKSEELNWLMSQCRPGKEVVLTTGAGRPLPGGLLTVTSSPVTGTTQEAPTMVVPTAVVSGGDALAVDGPSDRDAVDPARGSAS
jgi:hypothetical protein